MLIYVTAATMGSLFLYCSNAMYLSGRSVASFSLFAASVLLPCFVAAFRGLDVGSDLLVYGQSAFNVARAYKLSDMSSFALFSGWGPLYILYSWLAARLAGDMAGYLFAIQLLITLPAYIAIWRVNQHYAFAGAALFGLFFFPLSLNMMRQSAAMAFIALMMTALLKRRRHEAMIWLVIAALLHQTAVICLALLALSPFMKKPSTATVALLVLFFLTLYAAFPLVVDCFSGFGKYGTYFTGAYSEISGGRRLNAELTGVFIMLTVIFLYFRRGSCADSTATMLFCFTFMGIVGIWLSAYSYYLYRVGLYFLEGSILLIPHCMGLLNDAKSRVGFAAIALFAFITVHIDYFIVIGAHHVVPYVLAI